MQINELIADVKSLDVQLDRKLTPEIIRKLSSDGLISRPPRYTKSGPKGRGAPSDWPEKAVEEIAAYLRVRNLRRDNGARIPKSIIKESRNVGIVVPSRPYEVCPARVDENDDVYLDCSHDFVIELLRPIVGPRSRVEKFPNAELNLEVVQSKLQSTDWELERLLDLFTDHLVDLKSLQKRKPHCFSENDLPFTSALLEQVDSFQKRRELDKKPPLRFTVIPEVATWIAACEKVRRKKSLSKPVRLEYIWTVNIKLKKKPPRSYYDPYDESREVRPRSADDLLQVAPRSESDLQAGSHAEISYVFDELVMTELNAGRDANRERFNQDSVYVQYRIQLSYDGGSSVDSRHIVEQ